MYAVVEYNDYRKEQTFEVIITTDDVNHAKKVAFSIAKNKLPKDDNESIYKLTSEIEDEYLLPINKKIISYKIISLEKYKKGLKINCTYSTVYAVIELKKQDIENIEEIDTSFICNKYYSYDGDGEEDY